MSDWQWECFERYIHSGVFGVTDPGPLFSPICQFKITRNCELGLVLETLIVGEAEASNAPVHPNGTVRLTTETVEFAGNGGIHCTAHGVLPFSRSETHNAELAKKITQKAQVHSLTAQLKIGVTPAYTIDWLENLNRGVYVWRGSLISEKREVVESLSLGHGAGAIEISARIPPLPKTNFSVLEMVIAGVRLFLCDCASEVANGIERPGYIFYVGNPADEVRTKIRQVLSFCLGNYLVYLGSTMLSKDSEIVSLSAMSPPSISRVSEIPVLPPGLLAGGNALIAEQEIVARAANAVYEHYDELRFNSFSWAYWHAMCAPVHMAAGHFGAAIEALQNAYMKAYPEKFDKILVADKAKWTPLKEAFLKAIAEAGLEPIISTILTNKVASNLNQTPPSVLSEKMFAEIGITLGQVEAGAWRRRNIAAHGGELDIDSVIPTIMETKLLKIILHRIVLKITGASDRYYDDYTLGHAIRNVTEPVPSPASGVTP
ncbi:MAG TPA: hypothetical protein PK677_17605 [Acidiphilium sp.]|nr:hypothetical protein [Acidiphilium sp.]